MPGGVDLHTHTTASDGTYSPTELVAEAARRGIRVLAITDHDSTEGLPEAMAAAESHRPLEILPGIEINCDVEGAEIHVLGYLMDWQAPWFQEFCREQRRERRERVRRMAERLAALGMPIDPDEVFAVVKEGSAGRPHVAQVMVAHGYVKTVREAFEYMYYLDCACQIQVDACAGGMHNVQLMSEAAAKSATASLRRQNRPAEHKDWPALLRMLERKGIKYAV